jgi:hypothetical protein
MTGERHERGYFTYLAAGRGVKLMMRLRGGEGIGAHDHLIHDRFLFSFAYLR